MLHVNVVCIGSVTSKAYQTTRLELLRDEYRPVIVRLDYRLSIPYEYTVKYDDNHEPPKLVQDTQYVMYSAEEIVESVRSCEPIAAVLVGPDALEAWEDDPEFGNPICDAIKRELRVKVYRLS